MAVTTSICLTTLRVNVTHWNALMIYNCNSVMVCMIDVLTLTVLVMTVDAQWEGMGDVGSARYEPALLPPCPTVRVLNYNN